MTNIDFSKSIFVIDASSFVFRAYYALAPLSSKGRPSHAVAGFASMLLKLIAEKRPQACVVVFDSKKPSFRKEISKDYKANRVAPPPDISDQIVAVMEMCQSAELPILQGEGFEADDWIASFVSQFSRTAPIVIVSSDKDLAQMVTESVVLYDTFKGKLMGPAEIREKWQVLPPQMRDYLSLTGDTSDNIPGLSGVGPKTAAQLLAEHGSIENILSHLERLPEKLRLKFTQNREQLLMSQELVSLRTELPISFSETPGLKFPFPNAFKKFLLEWDCQRIIQTHAQLIQSSEEAVEVSEIKKIPVSIVNSKKDLDALQEELESVRAFGFSICFDEEKKQILGAGIVSGLQKKGWYIPFSEKIPAARTLPVTEFLSKILEDSSFKKILHDIKSNLKFLSRANLRLSGPIEDTMILCHLAYSDRRNFSLSALARDIVNSERQEISDLLKKGETLRDLPQQSIAELTTIDAQLNLQIFEMLWGKVHSNSFNEWLYHSLEIPLSFVLEKMESCGVLVDKHVLKKLSTEMHKKLSEIESAIWTIAGREFNIQSPKQLQQILFQELGLTPKKKTKTGYSTDESVLEELSEEHDLPKLLLEHRALAKLLSTYVDVLPEMVADDGRIHTTFQQTGTATGRLSSSDPNLQNIPIRSEEGMKIRKAFIPAPGNLLFSADYSQIELRLFAHMSDDKNMIAAFQGGRDIHSETAKRIFGSDEREFRSRSKAVNFGIIYGISAFGLSQQLGIPRAEAAKIIEAYFEAFPKLQTFMKDSVTRAREQGYTETLFGRRRPLPDILSKNPTLRSMAERIAINAPVQGTAADIIKSAMVRIDEELMKRQLRSRLLLQVHDELVFEVHANEKELIQELVVREMQDVSKTPLKELSVPLVVDSAFGAHWADL